MPTRKPATRKKPVSFSRGAGAALDLHLRLYDLKLVEYIQSQAERRSLYLWQQITHMLEDSMNRSEESKDAR